jgi:hypothetical protein
MPPIRADAQTEPRIVCLSGLGRRVFAPPATTHRGYLWSTGWLGPVYQGGSGLPWLLAIDASLHSMDRSILPGGSTAGGGGGAPTAIGLGCAQ